MAIVYLALGSNVGDASTHFDNALKRLNDQLQDVTESSRLITKPWGYTEQPDFLNSVIRGTTLLEPRALLECIKQVEQEVGRIERFRWGPREIDIDILFYDDLVMNEPDLVIPHASFTERDFVLRPLNEIAPDLIDPRSGKSVKALLAALLQ